MSALDQLLHGTARAALALFSLRWRAVGWFLVYVAAAGALLSVVAWVVSAHRDDLRHTIVQYLLPGSWSGAGEMLIELFLGPQERQMLVQGAMTGTLLLVSLLLFPVKERLSAAFEQENGLTREPPHEFPLWFQAWEEGKLALCYAAVFMSIVWLGYPPEPWRRAAASWASYAALFATWAIDFGTPLLQRHGIRYSVAIKVLCKNPLASLGFGALFALPGVLATEAALAREDWSFEQALAVIVGVQVLSIAWAAVGGTWLAARLLEQAGRTPRSHGAVRGLAWLVLAVALMANLYAFGAVGLSVHHKSQILKCAYAVDLSTLRVGVPSPLDLLAGSLGTEASLELTITNPTPHDLVIEKSRLVAQHRHETIARAALAPLRVPAGESVTQRVALDLAVSLGSLWKGSALSSAEWDVTLWVEVALGLELPVYLVTSRR